MKRLEKQHIVEIKKFISSLNLKPSDISVSVGHRYIQIFHNNGTLLKIL